MSSNDSSRKALFLLSLVAGVVELAGAVIQVNAMLRSVGITSVFSELSLASADKVNFALYLTLPVACFAIVLWAGAAILRGYTRRGGMIAGLAAVAGLVTLSLPFVLGYPPSAMGLAANVLATALMGGLTFMGLRTRGVEVKEKAFLTPVEIALVAVFSALTAVITGTTGLMLPSPTGGYTNIGDTIIFVSALLFGSKVGGLVGIIGPVAADLFVGYPRWFVTVLAHGSEGFVAGLGRGKGIVVQAVLLVFSGFIMATTYFFVNIFIKGYPVAILSYVRDFFGQALVSIVLGLILTKAIEKAIPRLIR